MERIKRFLAVIPANVRNVFGRDLVTGTPLTGLPRIAHVGRLALFSGLFLLLWLMLLHLPDQTLIPETDSSWQGALSYFAFKSLQFGKDVIFTYGPWGYIMADTYSGYLLPSRIGFDVALKGVFALFMTSLAMRLRPCLRWWFVLSIVLFSVDSPDAVYLCVIGLMACVVIESQVVPSLALSVAALFAFVSLTKFTFFVLCVASLLIVFAYALSKQQWVRASGLAITYVACLLSFWCLAGQQASGFWPFLRGGYELVSGYVDAMALNPSWTLLWGGVSTFILGAVLFVALAHGSKDKVYRWPMLTILCLSLFVAWKESFVRPDRYHRYTLFAFLLFAAPAAWAVFPPSRVRRDALLQLTLAILLYVYGVSFLILPDPSEQLLRRVRLRALENVKVLAHPSRYFAAVQRALAQSKQENALPKFKTLIGKDSVDVYGLEQSIALLNDFNYRPCPAFQGYAAYTPFLSACNRSFYLGPAAPAFVIFKYQTIDGRLAAEDDAGALEVIMRHYEPLATEKTYILWKRKRETPSIPPRRLLREGLGSWGEPLPLFANECPLWINFDIGNTWLGKLQAFLYKPARIEITLQTIDQAIWRYRLVRPLAKSGFIINPVLRDQGDVRKCAGIWGSGDVSSVTLDVNGSAHLLYSSKYHYRVYAGW